MTRDDPDSLRSADSPPPRPQYGAWQAPAEEGRRGSLADSLEPGTLRDELGGSPPPPLPAEPARIAAFTFTGEGAEYFRIWAVNLLLTLVTLGIYSAWAKVRKTRYFWQNTRLDGHAFDYHGDPRAILVGRLIALVLLVGYSFAFDISRRAGLVMIAVVCIAGPWLFMRSQRFKLANSSWRGLRFGFDSGAFEAYRIVLPPLVIWFLSAIVAALASERMELLGGVAIVSAVLFSSAMLPWMHHRLKAYQHRRARYGERAFAFLSATPSFYAIYFKAGLLATAGFLAGGLIVMIAGWPRGGTDSLPQGVAFVLSASVGLVGYLVAWPYFAARLQEVVWRHTRLRDVRFSTAIEALPLLRLTSKNVLLTLATAGLYWPFAAIALARYRVECMRAESDEPLGALAAATAAAPGFAAGDAAVDAFGLEIGL